MEEMLSKLPYRVTSEMNRKLGAPFGADEVKKALFEMFPTKALDDFPTQFFQRNWDVCGEEVTKAVMCVLAGDDSAESVNKTFIVLIPKVASPKELGSFDRSTFAMRYIRLHQRLLQIGLRLFCRKLFPKNSQL
jgi:hypothetical protein